MSPLLLQIFAGILTALPGTIQTIEDVYSNKAGSGTTKLQIVNDITTTAAQVAGVVEPNDLSLIQALSTAATNVIVAVNNATGLFKKSTPAPSTTNVTNTAVPTPVVVPAS